MFRCQQPIAHAITSGEELFDRGAAVDDFHGSAEGAHVFCAGVDVELFADCAEEIVGCDGVVGDSRSVGG
jgi:hypothetical protein